MIDFVIIGIIAIIGVIGVVSTIRHFKGEGGCCGGGSYKPKKKKISGIRYQKTFTIEGMHCNHCKIRVEEAVNEIKGVSGRVNLKKNLLIISYAEDVPDDLIKSCIERAGYKVTSYDGR